MTGEFERKKVRFRETDGERVSDIREKRQVNEERAGEEKVVHREVQRGRSVSE